MLAYVLNQHGKPLMPCSPATARHLLKQGKAKVVRRDPFTIKLRFGSSGYRQEVVAGMDTGSKTVAAAGIAGGKVVYQAEITLRDDVSGKMQQRAMLRRGRRNRKTRYRRMPTTGRPCGPMAGWHHRFDPRWRAVSGNCGFLESILADCPMEGRTWRPSTFTRSRNPMLRAPAIKRAFRRVSTTSRLTSCTVMATPVRAGGRCKHDARLNVHHVVFRIGRRE